MEDLTHGHSAQEPTLSALVVLVPEAEPVVGRHRERHDPSAAYGVPAHVTVLFPFLDPDALTGDVVDRLTGLVGGAAPFSCQLDRTGWFDDEVLWLAPEPSQPFVDLTRVVTEAFGVQPYAGAYDEITPHLTVAQRRGTGATAADLTAAEADVRRALPVSTHVERVLLLTGSESPSSWRTVADLPLGRDVP